MTRYYWCDDKTKEKIEEEDIHDDGGVTPIILMTGDGGAPAMPDSVDVMDNVIMFYGEVSEKMRSF